MKKKSKDIVFIIIVILVSLSILLVNGVIYKQYLNKTLTIETKSNLSQLAKQETAVVGALIEKDMQTLNMLAMFIGQQNSVEIKQYANTLNHIAQKEKFQMIDMVTLNGTSLTNQPYDYINQDYFQKACLGETVVTETLQDNVNKKPTSIYAAPVYIDSKIEYILCATKTNDGTIKGKLPLDNRSGFSAICNEKGAIFMYLQNNADSSIKSLSEVKFANNFSVDDFKKTKSGVAEYVGKDGEKNYIAHEKLNFNNWYVVSVTPQSVVRDKIMHLNHTALLTWIGVSFAFIIVLIYILIRNCRNKKSLIRLAFLDELTNFPNYHKFKMDAQEKLSQEKNVPHVIVEFDIRNFKLFNDIYGYAIADDVLKAIALCSNKILEEDEYCARASEDHFVFLLNGNPPETIQSRLEEFNKIVKGVPFIVKNNYKVDLCFGIFIMNPGEINLTKAINKAIYAKEQIKESYNTYIEFYSEKMYLKTLAEKEIESKMEHALAQNQFEVYLQPKIDLLQERVVEAEALVRWNDPISGMISPAEFIPIFEKNGFIEQMDMYMIEQVCKIIRGWILRDLEPIKVSINVSKAYIFKPNYPQKIKNILDKYGVRPSYIEIEITESISYNQTEELIKIVQSLKENGFSVSMDDFGSGDSSLNMLKDIPIDVIKIDQAFFKNNADTQRGNTIVHGIITIAKKLGIKTVAEGVENKDQMEFLQNIDCDLGQGYYFARPMDIRHFEQLVYGIK